MTDQQITCSECGGVFTFTEAEHQFYESKQLASPPKRCRTCRQARRSAREGEGGGGGGGGGGGAFEGRRGPAPRSFGGPPGAGGNPRPFGDRGPRPAPRSFGDSRPSGGAPFAPRTEGSRFPRDARDARGAGAPAAAPAANAPRWGERPRPARPLGEGEARPARARDDGGFRANATGERPARSPNTWGRPAGAGAGAARGDRPDSRAPHRFDAPRPSPRETAPTEPQKPRARVEKPRFDIVCSTCGAPAQVPFKPIDGREVFCQPCYRARRAPSEGQTEQGDEAEQGHEAALEGELHALPAGASESEELDLEVTEPSDELPPS